MSFLTVAGLLLALAVHGALIYRSGPHKPFLVLLFISNLYYSLFAYWYWGEIRGARFLRAQWSMDTLGLAALTTAGSTALIALLVRILELLRPTPTDQARSEALTINYPTAALMGVIGSAASIYVVTAVSRLGLIHAIAQPIFLIAYQISDILVPLLIFLYGRKVYRVGVLFGVAGFILYCIFVGFRYKVVLLLIPIGMIWIMERGWSTRKTSAIITAGGITGSVALSILTITRNKFGVPDFSRLFNGTADLLYGFGAEANVIFGQGAIVRLYQSTGYTVGARPILDSITGLLPRFLNPGKTTGQYMDLYKNAMYSADARDSLTAYPFVGEYILMVGWPGIVLGAAAVTIVYWIFFKIGWWRLRQTTLAGFIMLLAVTMGYYQYSRGFLPQVVKGYLFLILPYLLLTRTVSHASWKGGIPSRRSSEDQSRGLTE